MYKWQAHSLYKAFDFVVAINSCELLIALKTKQAK